MKIALDWIGEYLSPVPGAAEAAEALLNCGLPVESVADALGVKGQTKVLDVEVTSNRTDCLCHTGLARELSALTGGRFALPKIAIKESATAASSLTSVEIVDPAGCMYYGARVIRGVKVGPSPEWLRRRLESIGLRPVNNIVDITNFVLMELGQPLHAFDFDKLREKRIVVRRAAKGEKMVAIDGKEYAIEPQMLVIADAQMPVAIAGVMGGKESEVTEQTTSVLLESARFEPLTIRTTSRALSLKSDSSYRFERGIDPAMAEMAGKRAAQLMVELAGGELAQGAAVAGAAAPRSLQVSMRMKRYRDIIGIPISADRGMAILSALGFSPRVDEGATASPDDDLLCVRVPSHRLDVEREIDLIEEVARVHGYQHVPTLDRVSHAVTPESVAEKAMRAVRRALVEACFSEAVTVTFIGEEEARPFVMEDAAVLIHPQHGGWKADVLRPSLLPSLLAARRTNQYAGIVDARLFETAATYMQAGDAKTVPPAERRRLAAVAGDLSALTALPALLADALNPAARFSVAPRDYPMYVRGASGEVQLEIAGKTASVGHAGLFTSEIQKKYDLRHAVAGIELDLEALLELYQVVRRAAPVPRFPGIERDLSVVVEESVRWSQIEGMLKAAELAFLERINFVTTFRSGQVGAGKKSLTLKLEFRDPAGTLKSEQVDAQVKTAVETLGREFGASLRA